MIPLLLSDYCIKDEIVYFFSYNFNALFSYDYVKDRLAYIDSIPNEIDITNALIGNVLIYDSKIVLTPMRTEANNIYIYELDKKTWDYIELNLNDISPPYEKIAYSTIYGTQLILVGCYYNGIIIVDIDSKKVTYSKKLFSDEFKIHSLYCIERINDLLYIPSPTSNQLLIYDIHKNHSKWVTVGGTDCTYSGIAWDGKEFVLAPYKNTNIVIWDGIKNIKYVKLPNTYNRNEYLFNGVVSFAGTTTIIGLLKKANNLILDKLNMTAMDSNVNCHLLSKRDKYLLEQNVLGDTKILMEDGTSYKFSLSLDEHQFIEIIGNCTKHNNVLFENMIVRLNEFISII